MCFPPASLTHSPASPGVGWVEEGPGQKGGNFCKCLGTCASLKCLLALPAALRSSPGASGLSGRYFWLRSAPRAHRISLPQIFGQGWSKGLCAWRWAGSSEEAARRPPAPTGQRTSCTPHPMGVPRAFSARAGAIRSESDDHREERTCCPSPRPVVQETFALGKPCDSVKKKREWVRRPRSEKQSLCACDSSLFPQPIKAAEISRTDSGPGTGRPGFCRSGCGAGH